MINPFQVSAFAEIAFPIGRPKLIRALAVGLAQLMHQVLAALKICKLFSPKYNYVVIVSVILHIRRVFLKFLSIATTKLAMED